MGCVSINSIGAFTYLSNNLAVEDTDVVDTVVGASLHMDVAGYKVSHIYRVGGF